MKTLDSRTGVFVAGNDAQRFADLLPWLFRQWNIPAGMHIFSAHSMDQAAELQLDKRILLATALITKEHIEEFEYLAAHCNAQQILFNADDIMQQRLLQVFPGVDSMGYGFFKPCRFPAKLNLSPSLKTWRMSLPGAPASVVFDLPMGHTGGAYLVAAALCTMQALDIPYGPLQEVADDILFSEITTYKLPGGSRLLHCNESSHVYATMAAAHAFNDLDTPDLKKSLVISGAPICGNAARHIFRAFVRELSNLLHIHDIHLCIQYNTDSLPEKFGPVKWFTGGDELAAMLKSLTAEPRLILFFGPEEGQWIHELMSESPKADRAVSLPPPQPGIAFTCDTCTDKGKVRKANEDSFFTDTDAGLFVLADGMGGHQGGGIASQTFTDHARSVAERWKAGLQSISAQEQNQPLLALLEDIILQANAKLNHLNTSHTGRNVMGTTAVLALLHHKTLYYAHVGDSRLYMLRGTDFKQLTFDHSVFWEMYVRNGQLPPEEATKNHPPHLFALTRAVGTDKSVQGDFGLFNVLPGDKFLICSDGLTDELPLETIRNTLALSKFPARDMVLKTMETKAADNVTAIAVSITE